MSENVTGLNLHRGILISLDEIFDTRFSTLLSLDMGVTKDVIINNNYKERLYDEFDIITYEIFNKKYMERDTTFLKYTFITKITDLLSAEINLLTNKKAQAGEPLTVNIDINIYPYRLTKYELDRIEKGLRMYLITDAITINFINMKYEDLTLSIVDNKYDTVIMYNAMYWLDYHTIKSSATAVTTKLYGPALLLEPIVFKKEKDLNTMFRTYSELYRPYIDYTAITSDFFSYRDNFDNVISDRLKNIRR